MHDSQLPPKNPSSPPEGGGPRWVPIEPPPPRPPDAVIIPAGQLAEVLPAGLVEALEDQGPEVALDPRWRAARDAFVASIGAELGAYILAELERAIARRNGAKESARDLRQEVLLVVSRRYAEHVAQTGEALALDHPKAYLRSVCNNVARDHAKAKRRRPALERGVEVDEALDAGLDPEETVSYRELLDTFERERERLTAEEAEAFEGRVSLDLAFPEIAKVVGRPVTTVQTQFARAVAKLQAVMARAISSTSRPGTTSPGRTK